MEQGELVEVGKPAELLANSSSHFCKMASEMGDEELRGLKARAAGA